MKKRLIVGLININLMCIPLLSAMASDTIKPEVVTLSAETLENQGIYGVKITPAQGSPTVSYEGTWANRGGTAIYDPYDPNKRTVILLPPTSSTQFFFPGDLVTVAPTIEDPSGNSMETSKNKASTIAS